MVISLDRKRWGRARTSLAVEIDFATQEGVDNDVFIKFFSNPFLEEMINLWALAQE